MDKIREVLRETRGVVDEMSPQLVEESIEYLLDRFSSSGTGKTSFT